METKTLMLIRVSFVETPSGKSIRCPSCGRAAFNVMDGGYRIMSGTIHVTCPNRKCLKELEFVVSAKQQSTVLRGKVKAPVLDYLRSNPDNSYNYRKIASTLGLKEESVRQILLYLEKDGVVQKVGAGTYTIRKDADE